MSTFGVAPDKDLETCRWEFASKCTRYSLGGVERACHVGSLWKSLRLIHEIFNVKVVDERLDPCAISW